jgi:hypothetical protein
MWLKQFIAVSILLTLSSLMSCSKETAFRPNVSGQSDTGLPPESDPIAPPLAEEDDEEIEDDDDLADDEDQDDENDEEEDDGDVADGSDDETEDNGPDKPKDDKLGCFKKYGFTDLAGNDTLLKSLACSTGAWEKYLLCHPVGPKENNRFILKRVPLNGMQAHLKNHRESDVLLDCDEVKQKYETLIKLKAVRKKICNCK